MEELMLLNCGAGEDSFFAVVVIIIIFFFVVDFVIH